MRIRLHVDAWWLQLPWKLVYFDLEKWIWSSWHWKIRSTIMLRCKIRFFLSETRRYGRADLLGGVVDVTNKWHPLDKPLSQVQNRCPQPRRHEHPDQEDECNGSQKTKTYKSHNQTHVRNRHQVVDSIKSSHEKCLPNMLIPSCAYIGEKNPSTKWINHHVI